MPERGTVLLVESDPNESERLGEALEDAGYQVMACPGPKAPDYTCIGGSEGYCPLVERADVVVVDTWIPGNEIGVGTSSDELLELYAASGRTVVVLGPGGGLRSPFAPGHIVHLAERPDVPEVVAAVRTAPDVEGFVLRGASSG
jgi:CheY-like chemotaxis protein